MAVSLFPGTLRVVNLVWNYFDVSGVLPATRTGEDGHMQPSEPTLSHAFPNLFFVGDAACVEAVRSVYAESPRQAAFDAAVIEWRRRNPTAVSYLAAIAVANIILGKV
jgi:hypothetical protein